MVDQVFDAERFLREQEARAEEDLRKGKKPQQVEHNNIIITEHGAFKKPSKEVSNDPGKPQLFKLELNRVTQKVGITNKEGSWKAEIPITQPLMEFFGNFSIKYVVGMANASGKLHIEYGIEPEDQYKF